MAFGYNPQDANREVLAAGTYDAELTSIAEKVSKSSSRPMLEVVWTVPLDGKENRITDYIVNPSTVFKLKSIAKAWSLESEFDKGLFDLAEHVRRQIVLKLRVQAGNSGDQNSVAGYLPSSGNAIPPRPADPQPATVGDAHEGPSEHIPF